MTQQKLHSVRSTGTATILDTDVTRPSRVRVKVMLARLGDVDELISQIPTLVPGTMGVALSPGSPSPFLTFFVRAILYAKKKTRRRGRA